jgi:hypothetical protein
MFLGMLGSFFLGFYYEGGWEGGLRFLFLGAILTALEVSISFDNAVVNATVLEKMTEVWKRRFLTWGILIAVFGMRLVFPLAIVSIMAHVSPWGAVLLAAFEPQKYADLMLSIHHEVSVYGAAFLMLVALKFFMNAQKEHHWFGWAEEKLAKMGHLEAIQVGITLIVIWMVSKYADPEHQVSILYAGVAGILTFLAVEAIEVILQGPESSPNLQKSSAAMFLYLEVLDASFSFDGVVGAFAITNNLFLIAIGLGVGAMFVRSFTIMMVEKGVLGTFKYLEHGAFYAVFVLASIMFANAITHVPELITGLLGVGIILFSVFASRRAV